MRASTDTKKKKKVQRAEARVVAAAMRYFNYAIDRDGFDADSEKVARLDQALNDACAALKKAKA